MNTLTAKDMDRLFEALSVKLSEKSESGTRFELYVTGGGAMMLSIGIRRTTTDIDVVFSKNADLIHECALEISEEMGVDRSWCNDMVMLSSSYTPAILTYNSLYKTYGCLDVYTLHEELIFCMKLIAFREKDADDIDYLIDHIESKGEKITMADINSWFDKYYESFGRKPKFKKTAVQFIKETFR